MLITQNSELPSGSRIRTMSRSRPLRKFAGIVGATSILLFSASAGAAVHSNVALNEASNGKVVTVHAGDHLTLTLHSTYWTIAPLPKQIVITPVGPTVTAPRLPASANGCVPGQGCGTVTAHFLATGVGQIRLSASRTSCGEALRCTPRQSHWTVVIRVR
jgi:hypothetical protein